MPNNTPRPSLRNTADTTFQPAPAVGQRVTHKPTGERGHVAAVIDSTVTISWDAITNSVLPSEVPLSQIVWQSDSVQPGDAPTPRCAVATCNEVANWRVQTIGHPNGDLNARYCATHTFAPVWAESPAPYEIRIELLAVRNA